MRVVIVGNGIAGINAASAVRAGTDITVEVYAAESHPFYSRVRLPEVLSGSSAPEAIVFYKPDWYEKKNIAVHTGMPVRSIDPEAKNITLSDGRAVPYDYLVLATGASSNHPPIPGSDLPGVFTMRTIEDVAAIRANLASFPETASVIGGGLLGLEAARSLKDAGVKEVRVFEHNPRLLPRQLDETGAAFLQERFAAMGIDVVCGAETASFGSSGAPGVKQPRAVAIQLKDGRSFPSDTTVLSMGVHSNVDLAKAAGLSVNRGIVVDNRLRTSDPFIYALGDCAEFEGIVWGIVPAALEQAPVLGKAILVACGAIPMEQAPLYTQTVPKTALKVGDIELMSLGKAVLTQEETSSGKYEILSRIWDGGVRYEKYVLAPVSGFMEGAGGSGFILSGAILYGSKKHQGPVQKLSGKPVTRAEIDALLAD